MIKIYIRSLKDIILPVKRPLCALIIPVLIIPGWTAFIVTFAFLSCKHVQL